MSKLTISSVHDVVNPPISGIAWDATIDYSAAT